MKKEKKEPNTEEAPQQEPILRKSAKIRNFVVKGIEEWTAEDVCKYFVEENFCMDDAVKFTMQKIDGHVEIAKKSSKPCHHEN